MTRRLMAISLVVAGLAVAGNGPNSVQLGDRALLDRTWSGFLDRFVTSDGRVVRPEHAGDTVSEGQAYALLRAVWMDDRTTFDRIWRWTRANLSRSSLTGDHLLAWRWQPAAGSQGGAVADWQPATDADEDYALALIAAASRWPTAKAAAEYRDEARAVVADLAATLAVRDAGGRLVLLPGPWARSSAPDDAVMLNPSYLAPASYRIFARWTNDPRWAELADSSYVVLEAVCGTPGTPIRAVPDWIRWRGPDAWTIRDPTTVSGWDAIRSWWRVATDAAWFGTPAARGWLERCAVPLIERDLAEIDGVGVERDLSGRATGGASALGEAMAALAVQSPSVRGRLLTAVSGRLVPSSSGRLFFEDRNRYYVNSLAWLPFLVRAGSYLPPR